MSPFLRAAEARALSERERHILSTPAAALPKDASPGRPAIPGLRGLRRMEREAARRDDEAERRVLLSRAMSMRREGFTWEEIGHALNITRRMRDSLARAAKRAQKS